MRREVRDVTVWSLRCLVRVVSLLNANKPTVVRFAPPFMDSLLKGNATTKHTYNPLSPSWVHPKSPTLIVAPVRVYADMKSVMYPVILSFVRYNPIGTEATLRPVLVARYEIPTNDFPSRLHNPIIFHLDVNPFYSSIVKLRCRLNELQQLFP